LPPAQPVAGKWVAVNLTSQLQAWVNGDPNYGIMLASTSEGMQAQYRSRESTNPPYLEVIVGTPPTSPAKLRSTGHTGAGANRLIKRNVTLQQNPVSYREIRLEPGSGKDVMLDSFYNTRNHGNHSLDLDNLGTLEHTLVQFELGAIPHGARILSASLALYHTVTAGSPTSMGADLFRVTRDWIEGTQSGSGSADGATWDTWDGTSNWTQAGGDFDVQPVTSGPISAAVNDWESWEVGALVQGWVDGSVPNYGLLLKGTGDTEVSFASKEDADPALWPKLSITYTCACGEICAAPQGSGNILMVVVNPTTLVAEDQQAKDLFESWGYTVSVISESANQATFDSGFAANDVVFISETVNAMQVGAKTASAPIGVVSQDGDYNPDLGIAPGSAHPVGAAINITDNSHYITQPFAAGSLDIYTHAMEQLTSSGSLTADQQQLANSGGVAALIALDKGAAMEGGGNAAGRRVMLPLGTRYRFNWDYLNANGRLLVQRALAWGAGLEGSGCGSLTPLLLVVGSDSPLSSKDDGRKTLMESWCYEVTVIDDGASQAEFDAAAAAADVVYVSGTIGGGALADKLTGSSAPIVNEFYGKLDNFGFSSSTGSAVSADTFTATNAAHYISEPFAGAAATVFTSSLTMPVPSGTLAPDLETVGETSGAIRALVTLEAGATRWDGDPAPARRVHLPFAAAETSQLTEDGKTLMRRALEWAGGASLAGEFYLDEFPDFTCDGADEYRGSNGDIDWSGNAWAEVGDDGRACGANLRVVDDPLIADSSGNRLRLQSSDRAVERLADLGGFPVAYLHFDYRRDGMSGSAAFTVEVSGDGGLNWSTLDSIGAATDSDYLSTGYDISAYRAADSMIRLATNATFSGDAYIDNVRIDRTPPPTCDSDYLATNKLGEFSTTAYGSNNIQGLTYLPAGKVFNGVAAPADGAWISVNYADGRIYMTDVAGNYLTDLLPPVGAPTGVAFVASGTWAEHLAVVAQTDAEIQYYDLTGTLAGSFSTTAIGSAVATGVTFIGSTAGGIYDEHLAISDSNADMVFLVTQAGALVSSFDTSSFSLRTNDLAHIPGSDKLLLIDWNGTAFVVDFTGTVLGQYNVAAFGATAPEGIAINTATCDHVVGDDTPDLVVTLNQADGGSGEPGYTEAYHPWTAATPDTWETISLASMGVPANAVVEVAVINEGISAQRWGGVRAVGSTVDRVVQLQEAEAGGIDMVTMHAQADASSQIQHYSDNTGQISFILLGYWTGASYTDALEPFTANSPGVWVEEGVGAYGVAPNQVAEILIQNIDVGNERLAGLRASGATYQRRFALHEAESGGVDALSLMVTADASSIIEVYAQDTADVEFYVLGTWDTPPGTYTGTGGAHGQVSAPMNWETIDLSGFGVPADSIAQFVLANENQGSENNMRVRAVGSTINNRALLLHEAEAGGSDLGTLHANVDSSQQVQWAAQQGATGGLFYPVGWWVLSP
jgi:hypothetical protein